MRPAVPADVDGEPVNRPAATGPRKKASGVRPWLFLDSSGQAQVVEVGKHAIMRRTGLPARDLRILDPLLSYPSTVLGRERAIVINLEHIKAIITRQEVLLLNSKDPSVIPFVHQLHRRVLHHRQPQNSSQEEVADGDENGNWENLYDLKGAQSEEDRKAEGKDQHDENRDGGPTLLPFEFVALEACLESACSCLDSEARTLEQEAHPALDKLTTKISTLNLERVRQIKSRLVAITARVQKVRDELEHLLDDDGDMAEMYLTDKLQEQLDDLSELDEEVITSGNYEEGGSITSEADTAETRREQLMFGSTRTTIIKHVDVQELEMLLEAYFVQIDGTLNKLSTLKEYVDDTEDYINIMLDDKQNHLLQMGVMITTGTLILSAFVAVAGVFGMNITIELFEDDVHGMTRFLWTVGGSSIAVVVLYILAIYWMTYKRLLE